MRLPKVESGHWLEQKLFLGLMKFVTLSEPVDVVKLFAYRPEYFGRHFCLLGHAALRGPSGWSVGERELFGAFTSRLNRCVF
jgi:hypothetical protein